MNRRCRARAALISTIAVLAFAHPAALLSQQPWQWPAASRVVVVGDVHGAYDALVRLLDAAGIVDEQLRWSGGDARLVSLGDLLDRGAESRKVMELLMRLEREAAESGGGVHVVLGNHELLNLIGDLRYVTPAEFSTFAADEPEAVREAARARFVRAAVDVSPEAASERFEALYPPGYFGHRLAFRADGRYGAWLLSLPAVLVVGDTAFVHGGLSALVAQDVEGRINERIQMTLRRYLEIRAQLAGDGVLPQLDMQRDPELARAALDALAGDTSADARDRAALLAELLVLSEAPELDLEGPLWHRGAVYCNPLLERPPLDAALERIGARRVVVGHTPTADGRARALHDGRLIMLDTGMLTEYYAGRPAALLIEADRTAVQYLEPAERLPVEQGGIEAYGLTEPQILEALAQGVLEAAGDEAGGSRGRPVEVRHGGRTLRAVFYTGARSRAGDFELAAHALDRLLGLNLVPPTVARTLEGERGALQLKYPDAVTEAARIDGNIALATWCPLEPQLELMHTFDLLLYNAGRSPQNILFRPERPVLKLTEHDAAFGTERRLLLSEARFRLSPQLKDALETLDAERLAAALGDVLDSRRRRAVLSRRDAIVEQLAAD
jgi:hypothetical protein